MKDSHNNWLFEDHIGDEPPPNHFDEALRAQEEHCDQRESHHVRPELRCLYDALAIVL